MSSATPCEALVRLDRKISKALSTGKGVKLGGDELALLAGIGMIEQLADSKAKALKEQARCLTLRVASTNGGRSGSISSVAPMGGPQAIVGTSGGMTPPLAASSARARAQQTFG
ncbi:MULTISPECIES: hypothetical protein [unclassified Novosphingobium]|uniref:hypothetical protein n=1 Tax=unclassified Novosphingobium TaxID=2644732 RepID=UPI001304F93A|nr:MULTISPECIES: hypothetical protein [unclassified Novosphingobium]